MQRLKQILNNFGLSQPVWQGIGALIGLAGIVITIWLSFVLSQPTMEKQLPELKITTLYTDNLYNFEGTGEERIQVLVDGKPENSIRLTSILITNTGSEPILPDDYIEPIRVTSEEPVKLLLVESKSSSEWVSAEWKRIITNTFEMEPVLLNPGEAINVSLITSLLTDTVYPRAETSDINDTDIVQFMGFEQITYLDWTARIVNIRFPSFGKPDIQYYRYGIWNVPFLNIDIYYIKLIQFIIFITTIYFSIRLSTYIAQVHISKAQQSFMFSIAMLSYMNVIVFDIGFNDWKDIFRRPVILLLYIFMILDITWPIIKPRLKSLLLE